MADAGGTFADLGAVGNAARASKKTISAPQELQGFEVKRGDDGGIQVCETYYNQVPQGRRASSYGGGAKTGQYKETPFSDSAAAMSHIQGLLGKMGMQATDNAAEEEAEAPAPPALAPKAPPPLPPRPPMAAVARGPMGAGAAMRAPGGGGAAMFRGNPGAY